MLVLTRREGETLRIGKRHALTVIGIDVGAITLLIDTGDRRSTVRLTEGDITDLELGVRVTLVQAQPPKARLGVEAPPHTSVHREEIFAALTPPVKEQPVAEGKVSVVFRDDNFTPEDMDLVLRYLSAVYREEGGNGLKAVKGRTLEPSDAEVAL